jgi:hypothetical protein
MLSVSCPDCGLEDHDAWFAPTCGATEWHCPQCGCIVNLVELTGITAEDASNISEIEQAISRHSVGTEGMMDCKRCANYEPKEVDIKRVGDTTYIRCDFRDHYRSEGKPYDVELTRDGATVTARVWDMPEEVRNTGRLIAHFDFSIRSMHYPDMTDYKLYLRGDHIPHDDRLALNTFPTPAAARKYFQHITALLDQLNAEYAPYSEKGYVPQFQGIPLSRMNNEQWEDMKFYFLGPSYKPPFDEAKVRELITNVINASFIAGEWYEKHNAGSVSYKRWMKKSVDCYNVERALLTALGLDKGA